jgi:hypothetical protein
VDWLHKNIRINPTSGVPFFVSFVLLAVKMNERKDTTFSFILFIFGFNSQLGSTRHHICFKWVDIGSFLSLSRGA